MALKNAKGAAVEWRATQGKNIFHRNGEPRAGDSIVRIAAHGVGRFSGLGSGAGPAGAHSLLADFAEARASLSF